jgi:hypothetical protein
MMSNGASDLAEVVDEAPARRTRGSGKVKGRRRNYASEVREWESRAGMVMLMLNRIIEIEKQSPTATSDLAIVAREILQGK